jgi:hypothetical protein
MPKTIGDIKLDTVIWSETSLKEVIERISRIYGLPFYSTFSNVIVV